MSILVSVVMSSRSDWQTMKYAASTLADMSVSYEARIVTAWRTPDQITKYAESAEESDIKIIIASTSGAVNLPGIVASKTRIPVLAVPIESKSASGKDSSQLIDQIPAGVPVGTVAIGRTGAINAALLAASMLAEERDSIRKALVDSREQQIIPAFYSAVAV